jgi:hypothetical protein
MCAFTDATARLAAAEAAHLGAPEIREIEAPMWGDLIAARAALATMTPTTAGEALALLNVLASELDYVEPDDAANAATIDFAMMSLRRYLERQAAS